MANVAERTQRARRAAFLKEFARIGNITRACEASGLGRTTHYDWLKEDPAYREQFELAEEEAADRLESEARRRAEEGFDEYVVSGGKLIYGDDGTPLLQRRYSDALMALLLKAHKPDKYRDRQQVEHSGEVRTVQALLSDLPGGDA